MHRYYILQIGISKELAAFIEICPIELDSKESIVIQLAHNPVKDFSHFVESVCICKLPILVYLDDA